MSLRGLWRGLGGPNRTPRRGICFLEVSWVHLGGFVGPSWGRLGLQKGTKSVEKSIKILLHVGFDFWTDVGRFWGAKQGQVRSKIDTKSMLISKNDFSTNTVFSLRKTMIFMVRGVQVGLQKPRQDRTRQDRTGQVKTGQDGRGFWCIFEVKLKKENAFHPSKVTPGDARRGMQSMPRPGQAEQGHGKARASSRPGRAPAAGSRQL